MLKELRVQGFKSLKDTEVHLSNLNVLIGANGSGKSNFISLFKFLQQLSTRNLQLYVGKQGGADNLLYFGAKKTKSLSIRLDFEKNSYCANLIPNVSGGLIFKDESAVGPTRFNDFTVRLGEGHKESKLQEDIDSFKSTTGYTGITEYVLKNLSSWQLYHFHDTGEASGMKLPSAISNNDYLLPDASNLAPFLFWLQSQHPEYYQRIVRTIRLAAPFFDEFVLRLDPFGGNTISLEWKEVGSEKIFEPAALSDGTLRFICLSTLLLQPEFCMPSIIIIDEPELGLHPYAISILAGLLQKASVKKQVIVSTQSVPLVNQFQPGDLLIVEKHAGESIITRLNLDDLEVWMEEYGLGELWEKNKLGARPSR
jgi:predicted ATPase